MIKRIYIRRASTPAPPSVAACRACNVALVAVPKHTAPIFHALGRISAIMFLLWGGAMAYVGRAGNVPVVMMGVGALCLFMPHPKHTEMTCPRCGRVTRKL